ncbi:MAG: anaerobic ribonucleoside-triphosphate reductase activating protein [Burkholderiales bacterium]|nr:anaerobic ribonucleoside-triphosphate reductase activating protein [Burkholderiales bacterium]
MIELGGYTPLSTVDWPGRLAAVAFVQGCPWRCAYCHNAVLQQRGPGAGPSWTQVLRVLERRAGLLDGVVFSGGEPTLAPRLDAAVAQVRSLGLGAALHTAGIYPQRLQALLPSLAWVGFDLKTGFADYDALTLRRSSGLRARRALELVLASGVAHEIRTTYHPAWVSDQALVETARSLKALGAGAWVLQRWWPRAIDDAALVSGWRWPDASLLQALRIAGPPLTLR